MANHMLDILITVTPESVTVTASKDIGYLLHKQHSWGPVEFIKHFALRDCMWSLNLVNLSTEVEALWLYADVVGRTLRAQHEGRIIFFDTEILNDDEVMPTIDAFRTEHKGCSPHVAQDNDLSLILVADKLKIRNRREF